ncbi:hypothetical protein BH09VER1_BH09VER1_26990 [soil metagenome]
MSETAKIYQAGTLRYTRRRLVGLFAVLLLGDFCVSIFESIFQPFMPMYLKQFHASNSFIALITVSTAGLMNLLFLPNVSMWTDRTRTRFGRRIPFLMWSAPCTALSLLLIAFAPDIAGWLHHAGLGLQIASLVTVTLGTLTLFIIMWHFFNMVLLNVHNFIIRDVVPIELTALFLALFKPVGGLGHFVFDRYLFKYMLDYPKTLFLSVGAIFLVSFALICLFVKEGEYPDPPARDAGPNVFGTFLTYFRECLSLPIYRNYFIAYAIVLLGTSPVASFLVLFAKETLGLEQQAIGTVRSWATLATLLVYLPLGYLCKWFNPFRVALASLLAAMVMRVLAYFFIHGETSWLVYSVVVTIPTAGWLLGTVSANMLLFPADKFGQFSSGLNAFGYGSLIITGYLVGWFMDLVGSNYRMLFVVSLLCYIAAIFPMLLVYRGWKRHGGPDHYVPPLPAGA